MNTRAMPHPPEPGLDGAIVRGHHAAQVGRAQSRQTLLQVVQRRLLARPRALCGAALAQLQREGRGEAGSLVDLECACMLCRRQVRRVRRVLSWENTLLLRIDSN